MAINPLLLNVKPISEITTVDNPTDGHLLFYDGSDELKKVDIIEFQSLIGGIAKPLAIADASPTVDGWYKPTTSGTYANAGGLIAQAGYDTLFYKDGATWKKTEIAIPNFSLNTTLNPTDNTKGSTDKAVADFVDIKLYDTPESRINYGENTTNPQYFKVRDNVGGSAGVSITSDTESPTKDVMKYKRTFFNNTVPNGTIYYLNDLFLGTLRPSKISFSYWCKKTEFDTIFGTLAEFYFGVNSFSFSTATMYSAGKVSITKTAQSTTEFSDVKGTMRLVSQKNIAGIDYIRVAFDFEDIVWKSAFVGTTMPIYIIFNSKPNFYTTDFNIYDFTILFDSLPQGDIIYSGVNNEYVVVKNISTLDERIEELENKTSVSSVSDIRAKRVGNKVYFGLPFSETKEIVQEMDVFRNSTSDSANNNANFVREYLIDKGSELSVIGTLLKDSSDDIAPANLNNSYIGGNHGWNQPKKITKTSHGKTFSDIGKIGTDSNGKEFTIIQIIDANNFVLVSRNQATDGFTYTFIDPVGDLNFTSGVVSGYTQASVGSAFEFTKSVSRKVLINGITELSDNTEISADFFDVVDVYDVYDLHSVIERLIATANYSSNPIFTDIGADKIFRMTITYRFINNNCLINHSFFNYKKLNLSFIPFIQTMPITTGNLYINKVLPVIVGAKTYDFRKGDDWTTAPTQSINLIKSTWENSTNAPDRFVNYSSTYGFAIGYVKDKGYQRDSIDNAAFLYTSRKIYPYSVRGISTLEPYQTFSTQAFRSYQDRSLYPSGRISEVKWTDNGETYIMLDWNASIFDTIKIPKEAVGKQITIIEKTSNVTLLSTVSTSEININVVIDTTNVYGYLVMKIK